MILNLTEYYAVHPQQVVSMEFIVPSREIEVRLCNGIVKVLSDCDSEQFRRLRDNWINALRFV